MRFADAAGAEQFKEFIGVEPQPTRSKRVEQATIEPASYDAARMERAELKIAVQQLNDDLSSPQRKTRDGREMQSWEYDDWRKRATAAKRYKERRLIYLNEWIRVNDPTRRVYDQGSRRPLSLTVDKLVSLYTAVDLYMEEESDEAWDQLVHAFDKAREMME